MATFDCGQSLKLTEASRSPSHRNVESFLDLDSFGSVASFRIGQSFATEFDDLCKVNPESLQL